MIQLQTEKTKENEKNVVQTSYRDDDVLTWVYGMDNGQNVFVGKGPDNPSISDINYRIERANGPKAVFAHVIARFLNHRWLAICLRFLSSTTAFSINRTWWINRTYICTLITAAIWLLFC